MKEIPLTRGMFALVDDEDYEFLSQWKWHSHSYGYPTRRLWPSRKWIKMHDLVWENHNGPIPKGFTIDHKSRITTDCRLDNLRLATKSQQMQNRRMVSSNTTGYKGVSWHKQAQKWEAHCGNKYLGLFDRDVDAAVAYNKMAIELFGEFASLNEVE